ncbi:Peroxide-responsive repressor PerR [Halomicronema hongdechloris C2206]|uniref:Peroxide-responsive repressor PerR n=1 Tax=Halomicronema hongdechloris C2206 TaxID=1641165 RepID=A0A1Z3HFQ1_9CYAN|nr:Fur family transcriptional regulator [Halomicronema hongdechloris]ASC69114.1 Peroxide-responsive repressor PerR [Halomicronema hongdechloris C2206]
MGSQATDTIGQTLRQQGLRVTPQRYAVYANLLQRSDHPTVEQILTDLNRDLPISSQATVYSSLQALRQVGLVREVLLEEGISRYDANVDPHHHFRCRQCGCIKDIAWDALPALDLSQVPTDLSLESYEITIHGLCQVCQD